MADPQTGAAPQENVESPPDGSVAAQLENLTPEQKEQRKKEAEAQLREILKTDPFLRGFNWQKLLGEKPTKEEIVTTRIAGISIGTAGKYNFDGNPSTVAENMKHEFQKRIHTGTIILPEGKDKELMKAVDEIAASKGARESLTTFRPIYMAEKLQEKLKELGAEIKPDPDPVVLKPHQNIKGAEYGHPMNVNGRTVGGSGLKPFFEIYDIDKTGAMEHHEIVSAVELGRLMQGPYTITKVYFNAETVLKDEKESTVHDAYVVRDQRGREIFLDGNAIDSQTMDPRMKAELNASKSEPPPPSEQYPTFEGPMERVTPAAGSTPRAPGA